MTQPPDDTAGRVAEATLFSGWIVAQLRDPTAPDPVDPPPAGAVPTGPGPGPGPGPVEPPRPIPTPIPTPTGPPARPRDESDVYRQAAADGLVALSRLLETVPGLTNERVVTSVTPERLRELGRSPASGLWRLTRYWRIDPGDPQRRDTLLAALRDNRDVDFAYAELQAVEASVDPATNPLVAQQGFLAASDAGVDARWAWGRAGGRGQGVMAVAVEQSWREAHPEFGGTPQPPLSGHNRDNLKVSHPVHYAVGNHGTATMAVVAGANNGVAGVGIAHEAGGVRMASFFRIPTGTQRAVGNVHVADAVAAAVDHFRVVSGDPNRTGDVILVEAQRQDLPAEMQKADFEAISGAVDAGFVVVECAGNGNRDLDQVPVGSDPAGLGHWFRPDGRGSGAILVGAGAAAVAQGCTGHDRWWEAPDRGSNFGARVDCHAWGAAIVTAWADTPHTTGYGGTSGAAAIVAGVAVAVQGMHAAAHGGTRLTPAGMRALLGRDDLNTAQCTVHQTGRIGPQPDLRAIGSGPEVAAVPVP